MNLWGKAKVQDEAKPAALPVSLAPTITTQSSLYFVFGKDLAMVESADLAKRFSDIGYKIDAIETTEEAGKGQVLKVVCEGMNLFLTRPIALANPLNEYGKYIAQNFRWPNAAEEIAKVNSYMTIIAVPSQALVASDPLDLLMLTTHFAVTVLQLTKSLGIFWAQGEQLTRKDVFIKECATEQLPFSNWIRIAIGKFADNEIGCATCGMEQLGLRNLEVTSKGKFELGQLLSITQYLIKYSVAKNSLKDGETIAASADNVGKISFQYPYLVRDEATSEIVKISFD